jgi:hypothetical protein
VQHELLPIASKQYDTSAIFIRLIRLLPRGLCAYRKAYEILLEGYSLGDRNLIARGADDATCFSEASSFGGIQSSHWPTNMHDNVGDR